jgi:recombination protein RecT
MPVIEVWTRGKVKKHLAQYNKVGGRHYAMASENNLEMYARKVALLQVLKYMPSSIELANAITVSHASEEGKQTIIEGDFVTVSQDPDPETGETKQRAELPGLTPEDFSKSMLGWTAAVASGKKTTADIVAMARTRNALTAEQVAAIHSIGKPADQAMTAAEQDAHAQFLREMDAQ